jgi:hypothetical protein
MTDRSRLREETIFFCEGEAKNLLDLREFLIDGEG